MSDCKCCCCKRIKKEKEDQEQDEKDAAFGGACMLVLFVMALIGAFIFETFFD